MVFMIVGFKMVALLDIIEFEKGMVVVCWTTTLDLGPWTLYVHKASKISKTKGV
jgi:hypothetical protein